MASIIIQGNKEETTKTLSALKATFNSVSKKATFTTEHGLNTFVDVELERCVRDGYSDEEIDKGCLCCVSAERNCAECPFSKEDDCQVVMITEYSKYVRRLTKTAEK